MTITDEKLREAVEAFKFCIETASNPRIKASDNYIWSAGTREKPSINLEHLDNVLAALAELETLRAANTWQPIDAKPDSPWPRINFRIQSPDITYPDQLMQTEISCTVYSFDYMLKELTKISKHHFEKLPTPPNEASHD